MNFSFRERRRLKKLRKDKLRHQLSVQSSTDDQSLKRHKHRQKCTDELCKHRKHKKRRKHKKHHHRELGTSVESPTHSNNSKHDEYEFDEDDDVDNSLPLKTIMTTIEPKTTPVKPIVASSNLLKAVSIKLPKLSAKEIKKEIEPKEVANVKDEVLTEEDITSSVTEDSSGSSYVSTYLACR